MMQRNFFPLCSPQASPLVNFFNFHESFLVHSDYPACKEYLTSFKKSYSKVRQKGQFSCFEYRPLDYIINSWLGTAVHRPLSQ